MADQATVNANGGVASRVPINSPAGSMIGNVAEFGHDLATLGELQAKLAVVDLKEATGRAIVPAALAAGALMLVLASLPVALLGVAALLVVDARHGPGWALLATAGATLVVAVVLAVLAIPALRRSFASLDRSREELARNVAWIKTVLAYSGRGPSRSRP